MRLGQVKIKVAGTYDSVEVLSLDSHDSPIDLQFGTFDPLAIPPSEFVLLMQLDAFMEPGVSPAQFQTLFAQCARCHICIPRHKLSQHHCGNATFQLPDNPIDDRKWLLHSLRSDGLPVARFEAVFVHCGFCDRIMTVMAMNYHECIGRGSPHVDRVGE